MKPEKLNIPEVPGCFAHCVLLWQELHRNREAGGMGGVGSITWRDLHAFTSVTGTSLSKGDIEAIRVIEDEFFASKIEADERRGRGK